MSAFWRAHAREAVRFNLSVALYLGAIVGAAWLVRGSVVAVPVLPFLLLASLLVVLNWLLFTIVAIHRAATGQRFTYPMSLRRP